MPKHTYIDEKTNGKKKGKSFLFFFFKKFGKQALDMTLPNKAKEKRIGCLYFFFLLTLL